MGVVIPPDIKTVLKGHEYAPSYEVLRKTYWILCRNTSVTYISRATEMLETFTKGFTTWVGKKKDTRFSLAPQHLQWCLEDIALQKKGIARLKKGDVSGYKIIRDAFGFMEPFFMRPDEYGYSKLGERGNDPGIGLWAWMEKIFAMKSEICSSLRGLRKYPGFDVSKYHLPIEIGGYPLGEEKFIKDGKIVPVTGVWQPIDLKGGCPNFLIQGERSPKASIPVLRTDRAAWYDDLANIHYSARSTFDYQEFPTRWQLMWEDDRWRNGREPLGEYEYLETPEAQFPKEPPEAIQDPN
jgi:hypothetical protein